ncbi:MAG: response regulator [Leptospiraceae bacterium]|nr:response regulator [Leptospiraceae bacterium]
MALARHIAAVIPLSLVLIAALSIAGWLGDWSGLYRWLEHTPAMTMVAAIGVLVMAFILIVQTHRYAHYSMLPAGAILIGLGLYRHILFPFLTHPDFFYFKAPSMATSLTLVLSGAMVIIAIQNQRWPLLNRFIAGLALMVPLAAVLVYIFEPADIERGVFYQTMALNTSLCMTLFILMFGFRKRFLGQEMLAFFQTPEGRSMLVLLLIVLLQLLTVLFVLHYLIPVDLIPYAFRDELLVAFFIASFLVIQASIVSTQRALITTIDVREQGIEAALYLLQDKIDFIRLLNHEMRNQLSILLQSINLVELEDLSANNKKLFQQMEASGEELHSVINDALELARDESLSRSMSSTLFNIHRLLLNVIDLFSLRLDKEIKLQVQIAENIPAHFEGDEKKIKIIFRNLVSNACKYTQKGQINITLDWASLERQQLRLSVSDTGIGIPENFHDRIYASFSRGDNAIALGIKGVGLGLKFTKQYLEQMGGSLQAENNAGQGATFTALFHLQPCQHWLHEGAQGNHCKRCIADPQKQKTNPLAAERLALLQQARVLIVEDNPVNSLLLEKQLHHKQINNLTVVSNGRSALQSLNANPYDILLLDMILGDMTGLEVYQQATGRIPYRLPLAILLTGDVDPDLFERAKSSGIATVVSKPYKIDDLIELMARLLDERSQHA